MCNEHDLVSNGYFILIGGGKLEPTVTTPHHTRLTPSTHHTFLHPCDELQQEVLESHQAIFSIIFVFFFPILWTSLLCCFLRCVFNSPSFVRESLFFAFLRLHNALSSCLKFERSNCSIQITTTHHNHGES